MNKGEKRETVKDIVPQQVEEEQSRGACVVFTDGSYMQETGGGAAAAMEEGVIKQKYGPSKGISNYEMEAMALILGLLTFSTLLSGNPNRYRSIAIFSDSQAALELFTNPAQPSSLQYIKRLFKKAQNTLPADKTIALYWTPGHEGVELNEKADQAARETAEGEERSILLPVSLGSLLRQSKEKTKRGVVPIKKFKTSGKKIAEALNTLEKGQAAAIFQLRCGHCPLQIFLHRIGVEDDDKCEFSQVPETPQHFLVFCRKFRTQRQKFRRTLQEEEIKVDINSALKLLDTPRVFPHLAKFIEETGRFQYLKTYIEKDPT